MTRDERLAKTERLTQSFRDELRRREEFDAACSRKGALSRLVGTFVLIAAALGLAIYLLSGCSRTVTEREFAARCQLAVAPVNASYARDIVSNCTGYEYALCPAHDAIESYYDGLYEEAAKSCAK